MFFNYAVEVDLSPMLKKNSIAIAYCKLQYLPGYLEKYALEFCTCAKIVKKALHWVQSISTTNCHSP